MGLVKFDDDSFEDDLIDNFRFFLMLVNEPMFSLDELKQGLVNFELNSRLWHEESEFFDFDLANDLVNKSKILLHSLSQYSSNVQKEILAAILYLVQEDDSKKDSLFMGLEDDKEIFRYVLSKNGIEIK